MLTPTQWSLLQPLLPPPSPHLRGRPPLDDRLILEAILYKICYFTPWYDLPPQFPPYQTVYRRYRQWRRTGLLRLLLLELLRDLSERGKFTLQEGLECNIYRVRRSPRRWTVAINPTVELTWQVLTGWVFASIAVRYLYRRWRLAVGLPPPLVFEVSPPPSPESSTPRPSIPLDPDL
jgi:transposase